MSSEIVSQLQLLGKNIESLLEQKNAVQEQLFELESALKSLPKSKQSYKIVGKLLINKNSDELQKELSKERAQLEMHMKEIETQETAMKEKMERLQKELLQPADKPKE